MCHDYVRMSCVLSTVRQNYARYLEYIFSTARIRVIRVSD